jgi:hypothetical protein
MKTRPHIFTIVLIALGMIVTSIRAQDGLAGALSRIGHAGGLPGEHCGLGFVAADFDNDHRLDSAVLLNAGQFQGRRNFRIEFHDSGRENSQIVFATNETALAIRALDVNQDGLPDIVVEQAFTHKFLKVWLNDGHGTFRPASIDEFKSGEDESTPRFETPSPDQHAPALHTHSKRGTKLIVERGLSSAGDHLGPSPYVRRFNSLVQVEAIGPNSSRAPPFCIDFL